MTRITDLRGLVRMAPLMLLLPLAGVAPASAQEPAKPAAAPAPVVVVDLNTADAKQLETLPRIGPAVAARIIEYRKSVGAFKSVDELLNVKGIGEKTLEVLRPHVTVVKKPDQGSRP